MIKKSIIYLSVFCLTLLAVYVVVKKAKKSTFEGIDNQFSVEDTASVDRIVVTEKTGKTVNLERAKNGVWKVNGKFPARKGAIRLLLYTFKMVEVKFPAAETMRPNIFRTMATSGSKVEIYQNGERSKIWLLGSETPELNGSFMLMADPESGENYKVPYVLHIPGFQGILNTRFFTNEMDWRDRTLVAVSPYEIASIQLTATEYPDSSFSLQVKDLKKYDLKVLNERGVAFASFDSLSVKQYLAYFLNLTCEKFYDDSLTVQEDSVKRVGRPFVKLLLTTKNGEAYDFDFFHKPPDKDKEAEYGTRFKLDPNFVYIKANKGKDFCIGQALQFGKILQTPRYFNVPYVKK